MATLHPPPLIPPLESGDRLTREEFERRYQAMPELKKAELVEGVVYVGSPVSFAYHGEPHAALVGLAATYRMATPGIRVGDNSTVRLDAANEPQPDVLIFIPAELGGQARLDEDGYVVGPPDLAIEVAATSASYDLHAKKEAYRRNGVREYLVWRVLEARIDWFSLRDGEYQPLRPNPDGILRSEVFPGLWLDAPALLAGDYPRALAVAQQGLASEEHRAFVAALAERGGDW